jgi:hypothetical protein
VKDSDFELCKKTLSGKIAIPTPEDVLAYPTFPIRFFPSKDAKVTSMALFLYTRSLDTKQHHRAFWMH